jgi:hypothetical protein
MVTDRIQFRVQPMLATLVTYPFDEPNWVYEENTTAIEYSPTRRVSVSAWFQEMEKIAHELFMPWPAKMTSLNLNRNC